jgi:hypothetical protein
MLDENLALLYGTETGVLVRAVRRNSERFPHDFMFQLSEKEAASLRCQFGISKVSHGGRRYLPYVFTEQGIAMLSGVLKSPRAIAVNIEIMRAFVRLRSLIESHAELAEKLNHLERRYDQKFRVVFQAIRELMNPSQPITKRRIGFGDRKDS